MQLAPGWAQVPAPVSNLLVQAQVLVSDRRPEVPVLALALGVVLALDKEQGQGKELVLDQGQARGPDQGPDLAQGPDLDRAPDRAPVLAAGLVQDLVCRRRRAEQRWKWGHSMEVAETPHAEPVQQRVP